MGLITYENLEDGQKVTANVFNERFAQIVAQINGGLSAVNMEDAGITKAKLAAEVFESLYPVGSQYVNYTDNTNPATLLGFGVWQAVAGRVTVGYDAAQTEFNAAEKTGGVKNHTHTLSDAGQAQIGLGSSALVWRGVSTPSFAGQKQMTPTANTSFSFAQGAALRGSTDAGEMPPYIVAYVWKRVS